MHLPLLRSILCLKRSVLYCPAVAFVVPSFAFSTLTSHTTYDLTRSNHIATTFIYTVMVLTNLEFCEEGPGGQTGDAIFFSLLLLPFFHLLSFHPFPSLPFSFSFFFFSSPKQPQNPA